MTDQLDLAEAIAFMASAAVMLGRGEMPAPGTEYAARWYLAHDALISQAREAERMRGALVRAKELLSYAAQDTVPEAVAQGNRNAAWHAIDQALAPATGGGDA